MQKYSDGFKVVHVMLSDDYDGDIIEGIRTINDRGDFFRRAARKYLSENRAFNYIVDNQYKGFTHPVQGTLWFKYNGEILADMRVRLERVSQ